TSLGQELLIYALAITVLGLTLDRRLWYGVPPYLIGIVLMAAFPALALNLFNVAIATGLMIIAIMWRPSGTSEA
ncbi:MAG: hypothetical protein ACNA8W_18250, partial [Bradymonadaceae bacterium]